MLMSHYGLSSQRQPPPINDHIGLTFWEVAYKLFDCSILLKGNSTIFFKKLLRKRNLGPLNTLTLYVLVQKKLLKRDEKGIILTATP